MTDKITSWASLLAMAFILAALPLTAGNDLDAPDGFIPPPLHPKDTELTIRQLGEGVYALLSLHPFVDNSGFVVGDKGVLVIDAHISVEMAEKIQQAVRKVTDKPILFLVNTNYHGDHTFGNASFPEETTIIAHARTAERMTRFEQEKSFLLPLLENDRELFSDVRLRLPDLVFEEQLTIDLGGRVVEIRHFGRGNTPGDTIVYVPESRVAWTGNFILGQGSIPFLVEGGAGKWLSTLSRFSAHLEVDVIVPGHGAVADAHITGRYMRYLSDLLTSVRGELRSGNTMEGILAKNPLGAEYLPSDPAAAALLAGIHLWNLRAAYSDLTR